VLSSREQAGRAAVPAREPSARESVRAPRAPKLSWKEQQELKDLPARIEALEREQGELARQLADPGFYSSQPAHIRRTHERHQELEGQLLEALERWTELEAKGK
jgi:ATP-binding cassette subfamily F protein uup